MNLLKSNDKLEPARLQEGKQFMCTPAPLLLSLPLQIATGGLLASFLIIQQHASSLHNALKSAWRCACLDSHKTLLQLERREKTEPRFKMILDTNPVMSRAKTVQKAEFQVLGHTNTPSQEAQFPDTKDYLSELKFQFSEPPVIHSTGFLNALKSSVIASAPVAGKLSMNVDEDR